MSQIYNRQIGKSGLVVAAKIMTGDLKNSFVMRSEGNAKGVVPENEVEYEPYKTYVKAVGFQDGLPLVEAIEPDDEAIGLLVTVPRGAIPTVATAWGDYTPQIADVEFFGNKIVTVPLIDGISENIEPHESLELANATQYKLANENNNTRVLEPRKATETEKTEIAVLLGFVGV